MIVGFLRAVALIALALAACATEEKYKVALDRWLDQPESALVSAWGPPTSIDTSRTGERTLSYRTAGGAPIARNDATNGASIGGLGTGPFGGTATSYTPMNCRTDFTIVRGTVLSWRISGNQCNAL